MRAVNQYSLDAENLAGWSYGELGERSRRQASTRSRQTGALSKRILALGGLGVDGEALPLPPLAVNKGPREMLDGQLGNERAALPGLHDAINAARDAGDGLSRELFETILAEGEDQVDWLEVQVFMIRELGIENYLAAQAGAQGRG